MTDNTIAFGTSDDETSYNFQIQPVYSIPTDRSFNLIARAIIPVVKVEYLFEEVKGPTAEQLETFTLTIDRLVAIPKELLGKMWAAVEGGYMEGLAELIESTVANHPELISQEFLDNDMDCTIQEFIKEYHRYIVDYIYQSSILKL